MTDSDAWVLIVEDDDDLRDALADIVEDAGYPVRTAADGREAVASARLHPPAVVLLDLQMPVMDGQAALAALRQLPGHIPVVFMSAGVRAKEAARQSGADGYLEKPFVVEELLRLIACFYP
jgi:CheY-like chemotaxis protein